MLTASLVAVQTPFALEVPVMAMLMPRSEGHLMDMQGRITFPSGKRERVASFFRVLAPHVDESLLRKVYDLADALQIIQPTSESMMKLYPPTVSTGKGKNR